MEVVEEKEEGRRRREGGENAGKSLSVEKLRMNP